MKILFLGEFDPREIVVAPIKVGKELFNGFTKQGLNVVYLPYFQDGNIYSRFQKLFGFEKITYKVYRTGIFPLLAFVIKFRPQVIHVITPALYYMVLFPLRIFIRVKIIVTLHTIIRYVIPHLSNRNGYQKFRFLLIDYLLIKYSDCVFVYSHRDKRYICRYYNISQLKVKVVCNGVKNFNIKKEDFSIHSFLKVAFVGDVNRKEKDFGLLFNALSQLQLPVKLSIYSYKTQSNTTKFFSNNIKLKVFNPLGEVALRHELVKNDLIIQSSVLDFFPLSLLEAMNTGLIFLISDRIGCAELILSEFEDLIFPRRNTEMLIARIKYILDLNMMQKQILSKRIRDFSQSFSWEKINLEYLKMYNEVI